MTNRDQERLDEQLDLIEEKLPDPASSWLEWLRKPSHRLVRIPIGILLVIGSIFSILPLLGIWMLPAGLLLLAIDVPFLQRPVTRFLLWAERLWARFKAWRHRRR